MDTLQIILLIVGILAFLGISFGIFSIFFVSYQVYSHTLMRRKGKNWGRQISEPGNEELQVMWQAGIDWAKKEKEFKKELQITSFDRLKLVGEYFDFGNKDTVIILPGRRECLMYSYFYAAPYKNVGVNVLVIDQRAHGLSEGTYSSCGILEAKDVIEWSKHLHDVHDQEGIFIHGVCVGSCSSVNVCKDENCPTYIKGIIFDSAFINYKEIYANHMLELGHGLGITYKTIWFWFKHFTGCDIDDSAPLKYIDKVKFPSCFIWGKKDKYCLPEKSELIWENCVSENKERHWFENGTHSKLRLHDSNEYDKIVSEFIRKYK